MEHFDVVSELEQPDRASDVLAAHAGGYTGAVPTCEDLLQRLAHLVAESESLRHACRGQTVRHEPSLDGLAAGDDERAGQTKAVQCRAAETHMA